MKKNKIIGLVLASAMVFPLAAGSVKEAKAENFSGKEKQYYTLCSSSSLTVANKKTCKEFNAYLKNKNADLKKNIDAASNTISSSEDSINAIVKKIDDLDKQIASYETQIKDVTASIEQTQKDIEASKEKLKERIYANQSNVNSKVNVSYIFGSKSMTDFFSRVSALADIKESDEDLIDQIKTKEAQLKTQQETLTTSKKALETSKTTAENDKAVLYQKISGAKTSLEESKKALQSNTDSITLIASNMAAIQEATTKATVSKSEVQKTTVALSGNSSVGAKVVSLALSKQGCMYLWGAAGPNRFDCSGLVSWALNNAGVNVGRLTSGAFASAGRAVDRSQLQPGDIITFGSPVHHVGIYIGGNQFVHAPSTGKPVQVSSLTGYYSKNYHNARRLW